jgi:hypothetical protein
MNQILGRTGMTGDGIRSVKMENQILKTVPQIIGHDVPSGISNPAWVGMNNAPPEPTMILKQSANHATFMDPTNLYRDAMSSRFSAYHQQRLQSPSPKESTSKHHFGNKYRGSPASQSKLSGIYAPTTRGLGAGVMDGVSDSKLVQMAALGALALVAVTGVKRMRGKNAEGYKGVPGIPGERRRLGQNMDGYKEGWYRDVPTFFGSSTPS